MFINATGYHIPEKTVPNSYFTEINGLTGEWIYQRTGIKSRVRASEKETINYMCMKAVEDALLKLDYDITEVDLIIFASYTPSDTIATAGHFVQREYNVNNAKVFYLSSACSSGINAMEVIKSFFDSGMSSKALLICADRNSTYSDDKDTVSGHLWGDAAVAYFFSRERTSPAETQIMDLSSQGLGHVGLGPEAVKMNPTEGGLQMPFGKDVFTYACTYIAQNTKEIVERNGHKLDDLNYFIGHQANMRILKNVASRLGLPEEKSLSNIEMCGNTGSVSALLVYAMNDKKFTTSDLVCMSVFGGGYSAGACLMRIGKRTSNKVNGHKVLSDKAAAAN